MRNALIVIDVQRGFDVAYWGRRNNPDCESNVGALIAGWRRARQPIVFVRHDSTSPDSPLRAGHPGNAFKEVLTGRPDLLVVKRVNSAFHGEPDLAGWLRGAEVPRLTICGIQTNMCCETAARIGSNLGFDVRFATDATHTFDLPAPDGGMIPADELARSTQANLDPEFCRVLTTTEALTEISAEPSPADRVTRLAPRHRRVTDGRVDAQGSLNRESRAT